MTGYLRFAAVLLTATTLWADVQVSGIFTDGAVLQRERPVPVWGRADPGERVTVSLAGQTVSATADAAGKWLVRLAAMKASATGRDLVVRGQGAPRTIRDVLVGEVWHASGQSNMGMTMGSVARKLPAAREHIAAADFPAIRFRRLNAGPASTAQEAVPGGTWTRSTPASVPGFSAAAFYFARRLHADLDVPIGVLDSSRGGTPIEPFIPREAFRGHPTLEREAALGDADDLAGITALPGGVRARDANWLPGRLFHSRLAPVARYAVRGAVWYQGESNCGKGEDPRDYRHKMGALVSGWRSAFGQADLPVYFVQLPGYAAGTNWPYLREEQRRCRDLPHTGMVVTIDLVDPDIHPVNKVDVGERLARWALARTYDQDLACSGPLFRAVRFENGQATVRFHHAENGLMTATKTGLAPPRETPGVAPTRFELADAKDQWHAAEATIKGGTVVVRSARVPKPVAVRYAVSPNPAGCNLYNQAGLPASPFCSDPSRVSISPDLPKR